MSNEEYWLVPAFGDDGDPTGYYTREPDGVSGMSVTALADFCGVKQQTITQLLNRIEAADPITNDLSEKLKPFAGKDLRLITNDAQGIKIIPDEACYAVVAYYARHARSYQGQAIAEANYQMVGMPGMRMFIWSKTGYMPEQFRQKQPTQATAPYWYQRLRLAMSDTDMPLESGYFCVYEQMLSFFVQLESRIGYIVPDVDLSTGKYIVPDISIGKRFDKFLQSDEASAAEARQHFLGSTATVDFRRPVTWKDGTFFPGGAQRDEIRRYNHVYPAESHGDDNVQPVSSYPIRYLSIFNYFLQEWWITDWCVPYLQERDSVGVRHIQATINQFSPATQKSLAGTLIGKLARSLPPLPPGQP